jgi:large subunit ribosomal protein L24
MRANKVMVVCPKCGKATRIGHVIVTENGKNKSVRTCKKCGEQI